MKNIIKWAAIAVVVFIVIRILLGILFGLIKWMLNLFMNVTSAVFDFLSNINVGMTILTFVVMGFVAIVYFNWSANKSYGKNTAKKNATFTNIHNPKSTTSTNENVNKQKGTQEKPKSLPQNNMVKQDIKNPVNQNNSSSEDFVTFAKNLSEKILKELADKKYTALSKSFAKKVGFGESGAIEFVGSIILSQFDKNLNTEIEIGHKKVFMSEWSPLQFSDYMDEIVNISKVPYSKWSEVYRYLKQNHKWIQQHDCSGEAKVISPEIESFLYSMYENTLIDLDEITQIARIAVANIEQGANKEAINIMQPAIEKMSRCIIGSEDIDMRNVLDQSYWKRMLLEFSNVATFYSLAAYNYYEDMKVPVEKYSLLADLLVIAIVALPRENNYKEALKTLLHLLSEVNMRRGVVLRKEVEQIAEMHWSLDKAFYEVKHLIIQDNILNRIKL